MISLPVPTIRLTAINISLPRPTLKQRSKRQKVPTITMDTTRIPLPVIRLVKRSTRLISRAKKPRNSSDAVITIEELGDIMSLHADYSRYPPESFPERFIGTKLDRSPDSDEFVSTRSWSLLSHSSRASSVTLSPLSDSNQASLPLSLLSDSNQIPPAPLQLPYSNQTSLSLPHLPSDSFQASSSSSSPILLSDSNQTSSSPAVPSTIVPKLAVHASSLSTGLRWILMILMFAIARAGFEVLLRRYCTHVFPLSYL